MEFHIWVGAYDDVNIIKNIGKYLKTKFARAMLYTLKNSQQNSIPTWANVPLQDFTNKNKEIDWSKSVSEIDKILYKKYKFTDKEIKYIEDNVKKMN